MATFWSCFSHRPAYEHLPCSAAAKISGSELFICASQVGYRPDDPKSAMAFGKDLAERFEIISRDSREVALEGKTRTGSGSSWGKFDKFGELNFSAFKKPGRYVLRIGPAESLPFVIDAHCYEKLPLQLLEFMRQQRCGYNPWLDTVCHAYDGRSAYGPATNGTYVDARGGWHDAADLLKYQLTAGNATAQMLVAYQLASSRSSKKGTAAIERDEFNSLGQPGGNGVPDLLDEARWGLEWLLKLHPAPDQLYHQVADDRDHAGWRLPQNETSDYGWGQSGAPR